MYTIFWKILHALVFVTLIIYLITKYLFAFGTSIGINPPVDIHIPTPEEIAIQVQKEQMIPKEIKVYQPPKKK